MDSSEFMPRSTTLSRQYSSRYGSSACMLGTLMCTSQSIVDQDAVTVSFPRSCHGWHYCPLCVLPHGRVGRGSRRLKRSRQSALGFGNELFLMPFDEIHG